jgi:hypothetical protein
MLVREKTTVHAVHKIRKSRFANGHLCGIRPGEFHFIATPASSGDVAVAERSAAGQGAR